ncbi:hypothetical protein QBC47DRAFT_372753 [Echria macrotheca]|uniref:Uncharacterized protein n=1 Tax=Echria macrotheca TaxID=438768 RepID=A0AAJ0F904_9PEZI|nr:hypothetical protein QBC47DRAFT_372753 [Echria macrotheca]
MTVAPSAFDRLARRPVSRIASRLTERLGAECSTQDSTTVASRICLVRERLRTRFRCRGRTQTEKPAKKPRHWLNVFATTNRVWQCVSAFVLYSIYVYFVFDAKSTTLPDQIRSDAIAGIALASISYHVNVLLIAFLLRKSEETRGWRFFAVGSILGDIWMMGYAMSKLSILSAVGVTGACHGQEETSSLKAMFRNGAAFAKHKFGWGAHHNHAEVDLSCCLPKIVYMLCAIAIFSYTFSILFTGMQLQRHRRSDVSIHHAGHVEEAVPLPDRTPPASAALNYLLSAPTPSPAPISERPPVQVFAVSVPNSSYAPRRSTSEDLPRYASTEDPEFEMPRGRLSQETTSSFNPDLYLVSDGFRPAPELPSYSSRPPSYRSGPPSVRNL